MKIIFNSFEFDESGVLLINERDRKWRLRIVK